MMTIEIVHSNIGWNLPSNKTDSLIVSLASL
jgi:hypothetical protein